MKLDFNLRYGKSLLGLAREESGVLGDGIPGGDDNQEDEEEEDDAVEEDNSGKLIKPYTCLICIDNKNGRNGIQSQTKLNDLFSRRD